MKDHINPGHYKSRSVECINFTRHLNFCLGNAFKYAWRLGMKDADKQELEKIKWYMKDHFFVGNIKSKLDIEDTEILEYRLKYIRDEFTPETYNLLKSILIASDNIFTEFYRNFIK